MSELRTVTTPGAPAAIGPYSQGIAAGGFLFTSGQIPLDPAGGPIPAEFGPRVERVLDNLREVLAAGGCSFSDVVKTTVFLTDMGRFAEFNAIYEKAMSGHRPARSLVQVAALPKGVDVEIEMIASLPRA
jgi:2-iminobutanoate/2-iminopropanoate deaminase